MKIFAMSLLLILSSNLLASEICDDLRNEQMNHLRSANKIRHDVFQRMEKLYEDHENNNYLTNEDPCTVFKESLAAKETSLKDLNKALELFTSGAEQCENSIFFGNNPEKKLRMLDSMISNNESDIQDFNRKIKRHCS